MESVYSMETARVEANMSHQKPVIFLAFANDRVKGETYLRNLPGELRLIREALIPAEKAQLCEILERANASITDILDVFQDERFRDRIAIFHYGGHARSYELLLETFEGNVASAYREGLVSFFAKQKSLQLIFLNGCVTEKHALQLKKAGVPAIVGTSSAIKDHIAMTLAARFYNGMANGLTLEQAWLEAIDEIDIKEDVSDFASLYWDSILQIPDGLPWHIHFKRGAQKIKTWNLPDVANEPLFGLPALPIIHTLPEIPFLFLDRYQREHACIFFGRGRCIRDMYHCVTRRQSSPVILMYGQSGVGKSSFLEAGLFPRLEKSHTLICSRRRACGLLATLKEEIDGLFNSCSFSSQDRETGLNEKWRTIETKMGKPLLVILDQVEEAYTCNGKDHPNELKGLMSALKEIFNRPASYPLGKVMLAYRKEYHANLESLCRNHELDFTQIFLEPLDRAGIIEVITGLIRDPDLRRKYNLEILDKPLPGIIAEDLLADRNSPIAPTLQLVLTGMWKRARIDLVSPRRRFTLEQYRCLKKEGLLMEDFFDRQMAQLEKKHPLAVDSGLALDLLKYHTTAIGTGCSRSISQICQEYSNQHEILDSLLKDLKELYLLTDSQGRNDSSHLAHDILAPIVIKAYNDSDKPGQRASRILAAKIDHTRTINPDMLLDDMDLLTIKRGQAGRRRFSPLEKELVKKSTTYQLQRQRRIKRQRMAIILSVGVVLVALVVATWIWQMKRIAQSVSYATQAQVIVAREPTIALAYAQKGRELNTNQITLKTLYKVYRENNFYKTIVQPSKKMHTEFYSRDGKYILGLFTGSTARLWDRHGTYLADFIGHKRKITAAAFSPGSGYLLTGSLDKTAALWDLHGKCYREYFHEYGITAVGFSEDGQYVLTAAENGTVYLWDFKGTLLKSFQGHEHRILWCTMLPDNQKVLIALENGQIFWWNRHSGTSKKLIDEMKISRIHGVALSPDQRYLVTAPVDGHPKMYDLEGQLVRTFFGHTHQVASVTFSHDGNNIVTGSADGTARLWNIQGQLVDIFKGKFEQITSVSFSYDDRYLLTGSTDNLIRLWLLKNKETKILNFRGQSPFLQSKPKPVITAGFAQEGKQIVTVLKDGTLCQWNHREKPVNPLSPVEKPVDVSTAAFYPNHRFIVTGTGDGYLRLQDFQGKELWWLKAHQGRVRTLLFSPKSDFILSSAADKSLVVRIWNLQGHEINNIIAHEHHHRLDSMALSPDGKYLLTASFDQTARLWNLHGQHLQAFIGHKERVAAVAFSPNQKYILTGSYDKTARLWNWKGKLLQVYRGHTDVVNHVAFAPDGRFFVTSSNDETLRLWDLDGNQLQIFKGVRGILNSIVFAPGGKEILTGSSDGTARLWKILTPEDYLKNGEFETFSEEQLQGYQNER